jgi:hypothetical protein
MHFNRASSYVRYHMQITALGLALLVLLFSGCSTTKGNIFDHQSIKKVSLDYGEIDLVVRDNRKVKSGQISIPFMSFPGQHAEHEKKLDKRIVNNLFWQQLILENDSTEKVLISVNILKAKQIFHANIFREVEKAQSVIYVMLSTKEEIICTQSNYLESIVESIDASNQYIDDLLYRTIERNFNLSLRSCLKFN